MTAAILSTSIDTGVALAKEGGGIKSSSSDEKQLLRAACLYISHYSKRHDSESNNNILSGVECNTYRHVPHTIILRVTFLRTI
jgi:hypothetical protein